MASAKKPKPEWVFASGYKITWEPGDDHYESADPDGEMIRYAIPPWEFDDEEDDG